MQTASDHSSPDQPLQVCNSCKARKRRCDKALPRCSSCAKRNLRCNYSKAEPKHIAEYDKWWHDFPVDEVADVEAIDFPTISFLDPSILQHGQVEIPQAATAVPSHVLKLLGDLHNLRAAVADFFQNIHKWMPFISKKRLYDVHLRPSFHTRADVVLLLLSLKLMATLPPVNPRNPRTPLYHSVKHFYLEVEGSCNCSILVLQAKVLLSLYELGHGIYPAAFLSIGACARYAYALGINGGTSTKTKKVLTLVEMEEEKRVWWAIVILDRFVSIGCPGRHFATPDPQLDGLLPSDDEAWDLGIVRPSDSVPLSSPMTSHMSRFALLCQAARLLGQVLNHLSASTIDDQTSIQLDRTLQSMVTASLHMENPDYNQISFIYSALIALHVPWLYSDCNAERGQRARAVVQQISTTIIANLVEGRCFFGRNPQDLSIWGVFFAYHISRVHMMSGESDSSVVLKALRETFVAIDVRWNVAGVYLKLLEAQEVMNHL